MAKSFKGILDLKYNSDCLNSSRHAQYLHYVYAERNIIKIRSFMEIYINRAHLFAFCMCNISFSSKCENKNFHESKDYFRLYCTGDCIINI